MMFGFNCLSAGFAANTAFANTLQLSATRMSALAIWIDRPENPRSGPANTNRDGRCIVFLTVNRQFQSGCSFQYPNRGPTSQPLESAIGCARNQSTIRAGLPGTGSRPI